MKSPPDTEIWVETSTVEAKKKTSGMQNKQVEEVTYYFNAITGDTTYENPSSSKKNVYLIGIDELAKVINHSFHS